MVQMLCYNVYESLKIMTKTYVKSVWFFINFTLHFLRVYSQDKIRIFPLSFMGIPRNQISFTCESNFLLMDIKWLLNGTQREGLDIGSVTTFFDGRLTGSLTWNSLESRYNSTTIQCQTFSVFFGRLIASERALLLVQGSPGLVENFVVEFSGVHLNISWSPPFILDVPGIDTEITSYCLDIHAKQLPCSTPVLVHSECGSFMMNNFSLFIPLEYQCSELNISVLAVNFEGNGTRNIRLEKCSKDIKAECPPAEAPLNGLLGLYSSKLLEEGTLVSYTCNPGYIPSPLGYHAICTNKETWSPDPAKVTCKFIPSCEMSTERESNFTRLNNPSVAEVVISVGMAFFVGGGLVASVVVILIARKLWSTGIKPTRKDTSNNITPRSREHVDKSHLSTDQNSILEPADQSAPHQMLDTLKTTIRKLKPMSPKLRSPLFSLKPLHHILRKKISDRRSTDQRPDTQSTWQEEPAPAQSRPLSSQDFYNRKSSTDPSKNIHVSSAHSQAGPSGMKAQDFYSRPSLKM